MLMMRTCPGVIALCLASLLACSPAPPAEAPDREGGQALESRGSAEAERRQRHPLYRLTEQLVGGKLPLDGLTCRVGNEIRPSLGCLPQELIFSGAVISDGASTPRVVAEPDEFLQEHALIVERSAKGKGVLDWKTLPPILAQRGTLSISTEIDFEDAESVELWARPIPPNERHFRTRSLRIPAASHLQVGVGMYPLAAQLGAVTATMQLDAETDGERTTLLETVVAGDSKRWVDHEIDLQAFAGKDVVFHLVSRPAGEVGPDDFTAPLWGAPIITAESSLPRDEEAPNVIVISLDTLRADYVGRQRLGRDLTPNLDRFRAAGTVFTNAMTTYPSTTGSHMSLFTGVYPATHETIHARKKLPPEIPTLAQEMAKAGYATAAVTENAMLNAGSGFLRGFDSYREQKGDDVWSTDGAIRQTFDDGLTWLEHHGNERFFLFLHTYQVHFPYTPPKRHNHFRKALNKKLPEEKFEKQKVWAERGYAGEVLYMDEELGRLLRTLEERQLLDHTVIIITADHGEEFGEHGDIGHAQTLFAEVMNIPMSIYFPGRAPAGLSVDEPVSLVDIAPTVLDLAGIPAMRSQGRSLVPLLEGGDFGPPRAVYAQNFGKYGQQWAARTADRKFIFSGKESNPPLVFDLREDPGELKPLKDGELTVEGKRWINPYKAWVRRAMRVRQRKEAAARKKESAPERRLDESVVNKLRALGYTD